jgi:hypothetical protein
MTDRHFDFSIIKMIIPPKESRSRGENSPEGGAIQVPDEAFHIGWGSGCELLPQAAIA